MYMAMVDMAKAFDSVSHEALCTILAPKCIPNGMSNYILTSYMGSCTRFQHGNWESDPVNPHCGVKQGNSCSSHFFHILVDVMLSYVLIENVIIDGAQENVISFEDDTVLLAVECEFYIQGRRLPSLKSSDQWKYLGVLYTAEGRKKLSVAELMEGQLEKLTKTTLNPQQRFWTLRAVVIPSLLYQLMFVNYVVLFIA